MLRFCWLILSASTLLILISIDCLIQVFSRFLDQSLSNNEEKLEKHRFLVQSKIIEDLEYGRILDLAAQARSDEVRILL